jgi:hypothetical protein
MRQHCYHLLAMRICPMKNYAIMPRATPQIVIYILQNYLTIFFYINTIYFFDVSSL